MSMRMYEFLTSPAGMLVSAMAVISSLALYVLIIVLETLYGEEESR